MREIKEALAKQFEVKDMGELHYFLGVNVVQNQKAGSIWIGQPAFYRKNFVEFWNGEC